MKKKSLFGEELRRLRRAKEMSLADLADAIGCSIVFISDVERGKRNPPSPQKIRTLLATMGEERRFSEMLLLAARIWAQPRVSAQGGAAAPLELTTAP